MYDFVEEVNKRKDDLIKDIIELCKVPSVLDKSSATKEMPFGINCNKALEKMLEYGKRDGFIVENVDGYAGQIDIGEGNETLGILGHVDVVPVNKEGWNSDPFNPVIIDNVLYGRGVADDKGPLLAAYYGAKIVNDLNIPTKRKIRIIFGNNEENGSLCVKHYFTKKPYCDLGFTPDGNFPAIIGEKAICRINLESEFEQDNIIGIYAGKAVNVVPDNCEAYIQGNYKQYRDSYNDYLNKYNLTGYIEEEGNHTKLVLNGKAAHGSTPNLGINSILYMCHYLKTISNNKFVSFIDDYLFNDLTGKKLGIKQLGKLGSPTINLGIIKYKNHKGTLTIDARLSCQETKEEIIELINKVITPYNLNSYITLSNYLYVDPSEELIVKLHEAYVEYTGDLINKPQIIGGGTYAKEMPNCVAFGAQFPNEDNLFHQDNEKISIDSLLKATAIYAKAIYELVKA